MKQKMTAPSEVKLQDSLDVITSGLQRGESVDAVLAQSGTASEDLEDFVDIIHLLQASLGPRDPGANSLGNWNWTYSMVGVASSCASGRCRLCGISRRSLALIAGCLLLMLRRLFGSDSGQDIQEEAIASSA